MVMGDFNAHSPYDADLYDPNGPLLTRMKKGDKGKGLEGNLVDGDFDYAVISSFLSLPLGDVVRKHTQGMAQREVSREGHWLPLTKRNQRNWTSAKSELITSWCLRNWAAMRKCLGWQWRSQLVAI